MAPTVVTELVTETVTNRDPDGHQRPRIGEVATKSAETYDGTDNRGLAVRIV